MNNREKSSIAPAILKKEQFDSYLEKKEKIYIAPKIILYTNNNICELIALQHKSNGEFVLKHQFVLKISGIQK